MTGPPPRAVSFWRRRVVAPITAQLTLGATPDRLAFTVAIGATAAIFPLLGATTALTLVAGLSMRLNQVVLHTINQLLGPLQLALILVYVRAGEWLWRTPSDDFSVADVVTTFHQRGLGDFLRRFGWAGVHAVSAWALSAPLVVGAVYLVARPPIRRLSGATRALASAP